MIGIAQLPNEILLDIFERFQDKPSDLVNIIKTCRRWQRLGCTILYQHLTLNSKLRNDSATARFTRTVTQCDLIQSFSLRITQVHLMGFSILSVEAFDRLTELCDMLATMKNMQTFALSFEEPTGEGFTAPSGAIVSLLQSLPKTVVNLSIDCGCLASPELNQPHICDAIGALLPRLRSLQLHISHICSGLLSNISSRATLDHDRPNFPAKTTSFKTKSSLECLFIRLIMRPKSNRGPHSVLCYTGNKPMQGARLTNTLYSLQKMGAFPLLRQFAVVGRVDAQATPQNDNWNVFKVRSFINQSMTTTTFPWCARGGSSSLYMIRGGEEDWFGSFDEITSALQGSLSWTKSGMKCRAMPAHNLNHAWRLRTSELASRKSVVHKFGVSFRLWKHEDATRMRLLHVRTARGFDDTEPSSQTIPAGWRWVEEGPWNWTITAV
jgi:hypothetical protein